MTWTISSTNGYCADESESYTITGKGIADPTVSITNADPTTLCVGDVVTITATGNNGGTLDEYEFTDANGGSQGPTTGANTYDFTVVAGTTTITVEYTSNSSCLSAPTANKATATIDVIGVEAPTATILTPTTDPAYVGNANPYPITAYSSRYRLYRRMDK